MKHIIQEFIRPIYCIEEEVQDQLDEMTENVNFMARTGRRALEPCDDDWKIGNTQKTRIKNAREEALTAIEEYPARLGICDPIRVRDTPQ